MNQALWQSVGMIGDDLISEADTQSLLAHFNKKRHRTKMGLRAAAIAAAVCLLVITLAAILPAFTSKAPEINTDNFIPLAEYTGDDQSSSSPAQCPTGPFQGRIGYRVLAQRLGYEPGKPALLVLSYGLVRELPLDGIVKVTVDTGAFTTSSPREITVGRLNLDEHYGYQALKLALELIPPAQPDFGEIKIEFRFYPDDPDSSVLSGHSLDENGSLCLTRIEVPYLTNEFEIAFSPLEVSAREFFLDRLPILYEKGKISAKQFADIYCDIVYRDTVYVEMYQKNIIHGNGFRFCYFSKNIRYKSPILTDYELAKNQFQPKSFAVAALLYMKKNGIITTQELQAELLLLDEVELITDEKPQTQHLHYSSESFNILQKNMLTH